MERNVVIVQGRCARTLWGFGIRFERFRPNQWTATWAFAIKEAVAQREGYDKTKIAGTFLFDPAYPGCPHCGQTSIVLCGSCHQVACYDGESTAVTCPGCKAKKTISGTMEELHAGGDR